MSSAVTLDSNDNDDNRIDDIDDNDDDKDKNKFRISGGVVGDESYSGDGNTYLYC